MPLEKNLKPNDFLASSFGPDPLGARTLRFNHSNPGSNPGLDRLLLANEINGTGSKTDHNKNN